MIALGAVGLCGLVAIALGLLAIASPPPLSAAGDLHGTVAASGIEAGLAVHAGTTDGTVEVWLAQSGRLLVHGLAREGGAVAAARQAISARGLYGLASIQRRASLNVLPYADDLVNLLIVDRDRLGKSAPPREEMLRVLAPHGVACVKRGGRWSRTVKALPAAMDEWTHFDYGPSGNAVSHDRLVAPPTHVQWVSGLQPMQLGGNPAGFPGSPGVRVAGGRVFSDWITTPREGRFGAWDAFNGVPLWSIESAYSRRRPLQLVAVDDRVYMWTEPDGPLVALDAATGATVCVYEHAGLLPQNTGLAAIRVCGDRLIAVNEGRLSVVDARTGGLQWRFSDVEEGLLFFPSVDQQANRLYVVVSDVPSDAKIEYRWPNARAAAIACLDLRNGALLWRNTEVAGSHIGQLVPYRDYLGVFAGGGIGAGQDPFIGNIRVKDGTFLWRTTFPLAYNRAGYVMLWRDGALYYADPWRVYRVDPETGEEAVVFGSNYNGRCTRFCATDNYLIHSFVAYVDREFTGTLQSVARSACANSTFPAYGMLYFTPNTCQCFTMLRGHLALATGPLQPPVEDALRLERGEAGAVSIPVRASRAPEPPSSLIAEHWSAQERSPLGETEPVTAGGRTFTAVTHEHRMECRDGQGNAVWSYVADGRISSPPAIHGGLCVFGCHDGRVYAVRVSDGSLAWRFLAAPYERLIVSHGQLESSWPVYGVALHQGLICASAGLHPEIGGGIYVWGLDPHTGDPVWKRLLAKSPAVLRGTERAEGRIVPNSALNDVLRSEGHQLSLPGYRDARFVFDPAMTDDELRARLETPPADRRR